MATYNGDANFNSTTASTTLSVSASPVPVTAPTSGGPLSSPGGAGVAKTGQSASGVTYTVGGITLTTCPLLAADSFGAPQTYNPTVTTRGGYADGVSGNGVTTFAHLVQVSGNDSVALVAEAGSAYFFDSYSGAYHARYGGTATFAHDTLNGRFVATDGTGRVLTFYDFSGGTPTGRGGKLLSVAEPGGQVTAVTSWDGSGRPTEVQTTTGTGGGALTESLVYTYLASGTNAGLMDTVTQRTKVGAGSWVTVRSVANAYYDGITGPGLAGELRTATVKDGAGTDLDTNYYRYYTSGTGSSGNIKYTFGAAAYARLTAALGTGVDSLTDGQVDDYAENYAEYDSSGRVTKVIAAAAGCSVCSGGQGEFTYAYTANSAAGPFDPNGWAVKTVETLPNGTTNTVYTNGAGEVMLSAVADGSGSV